MANRETGAGERSRWAAVVEEVDGAFLARPLVDGAAPPRPLDAASQHTTSADSVVVVSTLGGGKVRIEHTLASGGTTLADVYRLAGRHDVNPLYPPEVHAEVDRLIADPGLEDPALENLEQLPFVTIDNTDSRDLDQAIYIEANGEQTTVYYALADAAHYIRPGSALFAEALARGSSFYLPGLAIPMLPRALSEGLISLNEGVVRRALVFVMELDREAACRQTRLAQCRIRSRRKLSYRRVQRAWDDPWGSSFDGEDFAESLHLLRRVGELRIADARRRQVVDYNRRELSLRPKGEGWAIEPRQRLHVERCNEQISLLCNIEGARLLVRGRGLEHVQPIFRVHPEPGADRLRALRSRISHLVRLHGLQDDRWRWKAGQNLDEYLRNLPSKVRPRLAAAIHRQAILTNRRSLFGAEPGPHHGIGAPVYARFSSPMREIVGVFTHKEALEQIRGPANARPTAADIELRDRVVARGNFSKSLQRTLEKEAHLLALDHVFGRELHRQAEKRTIRHATVLGMKPHLVYVRLDDPQLEIKLHLKDLERITGERWRGDRRLVEVRPPADSQRPPLRMGGLAKLRLWGHDRKRRRWLFEPVR